MNQNLDELETELNAVPGYVSQFHSVFDTNVTCEGIAKSEDTEKFRTPSLCNVAQTAPYMHDGSQATLSDAVTFHYRGATKTPDIEPLLGQSFSEIAPIVAFLDSLTGDAPDVSPPKLP
jgi:cytochrome c peroxidase